MKIVFIGPFGLQPKATMRTRALPLARALVSRGHTVTVLIPPWDDPERAGQSWQDAGVRVINVPLPPGFPLLFHILLTRALVARTMTLQPDVVHFFKPKAYAGLAHLILWWLRRLGGGSTRLVVDADDWEQAWNERVPYSQAQKKVFVWQERWGLRHADAVTVASRALEALVVAQRAPGQNGVYYVPNGVALDSNTEQREESQPDIQQLREKWQFGQAPIILLYSRFVEFRLERIVALVQEVAHRMPEARWLIIGQGLQGEEKKLAVQLAQAGYEDYVHFTGWPVEQLPAHFAAADVVAFPFDDTLINRTKCSVKLIDLLSAGLPVVADDVGQNCEYIQHNSSGILVSAEDDAAFSQALVDLLQAPEKRHQLGQAAAQNIRENFNWVRLSQNVERVYR